jgi:hypothetical protein
VVKGSPWPAAGAAAAEAGSPAAGAGVAAAAGVAAVGASAAGALHQHRQQIEAQDLPACMCDRAARCTGVQTQQGMNVVLVPRGL